MNLPNSRFLQRGKLNKNSGERFFFSMRDDEFVPFQLESMRNSKRTNAPPKKKILQDLTVINGTNETHLRSILRLIISMQECNMLLHYLLRVLIDSDQYTQKNRR